MSQNRDLKCVECEASFVWTVGEQEYYRQKGFTEPKRCPPCRQKNKERKAEKQLGRSR